MSLISVSEAACMSIVSGFEAIVSKAYVCFLLRVVLSGHCCLVDYSLCKALSIQGALVVFPTVAVTFCGVLGLVFPYYCTIVVGDFLFYVRHTAIAYFDSIAVEEFVKLVTRWKAVVY